MPFVADRSGCGDDLPLAMTGARAVREARRVRTNKGEVSLSNSSDIQRRLLPLASKRQVPGGVLFLCGVVATLGVR
jgi:hypothetical protein